MRKIRLFGLVFNKSSFNIVCRANIINFLIAKKNIYKPWHLFILRRSTELVEVRDLLVKIRTFFDENPDFNQKVPQPIVFYKKL